MAKLPSVINGLMWPPEAGSAAKIKRVRFTPARVPPIIGRRNGEVMLRCLLVLDNGLEGGREGVREGGREGELGWTNFFWLLSATAVAPDTNTFRPVTGGRGEMSVILFYFILSSARACTP